MYQPDNYCRAKFFEALKEHSEFDRLPAHFPEQNPKYAYRYRRYHENLKQNRYEGNAGQYDTDAGHQNRNTKVQPVIRFDQFPAVAYTATCINCSAVKLNVCHN